MSFWSPHGHGVGKLLDLVDERLRGAVPEVEVEVDYADGETLAWLHRRGDIKAETDTGTALRVTVALPLTERENLERRLRRGLAEPG